MSNQNLIYFFNYLFDLIVMHMVRLVNKLYCVLHDEGGGVQPAHSSLRLPFLVPLLPAIFKCRFSINHCSLH